MNTAPMNEKLKKALKLEGFLKKQSPTLTKSYQQRYFKIMDNGRTLGYASSKEDFNRGEKIKGQIPIKDITSLVTDEKPLKFHLITKERTYKLEAESRDKKAEWIEAIKLCQEYALEQDRLQRERYNTEDLEIRIDKAKEEDTGKRSASSIIFQPFTYVAKTAKAVIVDTAINKTVTAVKSGVQALDDLAFDNTPKANEEYLQIKKYKEALDRYDQKILKCRIIMGFLNEEHKEAVGNSLVDSLVNDSGLRNPLKKRWVMFISRKPLIPELTDPNDEEILNPSLLPEDIEPETLYWFEYICNSSKAVGSLKIELIQEIVIREKLKTEQFYRFILDIGEKKYFFTTPFLSEMDKWVAAIQASRATVREMSKSRLPDYKNISLIVRLYDSENGLARLQEKIISDYNRLMGGSESKELTRFLQGIKTVGYDYVMLINSCICQRERRFDIIKVYATHMHEGICKSLRNYFQKKGSNLTVPELLEIVYFFFWYRDELKKVSTVFIDDKILDSANLMSSIITKRIIRYNLGMINQLLRNEMDNPPNTMRNGKIASTTPGDFLQILRETINFYENCKTVDMAECLLEACDNTTQYYQDGLIKTMTETNTMTADQYAAICNNVAVIKNLCREFTQRAVEQLGLNEEKVKKNFNCDELDLTWDRVAERAHERMIETSFRGLDNIIIKFSILDINFEVEFRKGIDGIIPNRDKIEPIYHDLLYYDALKKCVRSFTKSLIFSLEKKKIKKTNYKKILERLNNLIEELTRLFSEKVGAIELEKQLENIRNFEDFLTTNYAQLAIKCQFMKETYGNALTWSHLQLLISMKEDEIPPEEKKSIMDQCRTAFKNSDSNSARVKSDLFEILVEEAKNDEEGTETTNEGNEDTIEIENNQQEQILEKKNPKKVIKTNLFGNLSMNKDEGIISTWDTKYVILRKDRMYYYKSRDSEKADGNIPFNTVESCEPHAKDSIQFILKMKDQKQIKFKVSNAEERSKWIEAICELMKGSDNTAEIETDEIFYTDNTPLFKMEEKPNLAFNYDVLKKMKNTGQIKVQNIMEASNTLKMSLATPQQDTGCCKCLRRNKDNSFYQQLKQI